MNRTNRFIFIIVFLIIAILVGVQITVKGEKVGLDYYDQHPSYEEITERFEERQLEKKFQDWEEKQAEKSKKRYKRFLAKKSLEEKNKFLKELKSIKCQIFRLSMMGSISLRKWI